MAAPSPAPWWARPTMASLDGPAFVVLARYGLRPSPPRAADTVLIGALVWAGYVADRWLDARHDADTATWRHGSARRLGPWLFALALLLGLAAVSAGASVGALWLAVIGPFGRWLPLGVAVIFCGRWLRVGWPVRSLCVAWLMCALACWRADWPAAATMSVALLALANLTAIRRAERPGEHGLAWWACAVFALALTTTLVAPSALSLAVAAVTGLLCLFGAGSGRHAERRRAIVDAVTLLALGAAALTS